MSENEHDCLEKAEKQIRGLSLLRDHLEEELGKMRLQRSELQNENAQLRHQRDREHELGMRAAQNWHRVTMERDEARQWARKRYSRNVIMGIQRENADLRQLTGSRVVGLLPRGTMYEGIIDGMHQFYEPRDGIVYRRGTGLDVTAMKTIIADREDLRTQLAEAQKDLSFQESVKEVRAVSVADQIRDLCYERDDARNKALDEAASNLNSFADMLFSQLAECYNDAADRVRSFKTV